MASGLLKYVGRPIEPPPKQEAADDLNDRVKARMERMGLVEDESTRRRSDQLLANRQIIADRARVTPRSLRLTRGTIFEPVDSDIEAKKPKVIPLQRSDSLPGITHYPEHDNAEGGLFDTDAENLDSTTNLSDGGDGSISRSWHEGEGELAVISRHPYPANSDYQESLLPSVDLDTRQRAHIEEDFTDGDSDEGGQSENGGGPYQSSINGQPQYGLEAMQDLMQEQRQNAEQSPMSGRDALDDVMDSPSIQQSLAYRNMTVRPKHTKPKMPSLFRTSSHGPTQTLDNNDGGVPFLQHTDKAVTTVDMNFVNSAEPEKVKQIARYVLAKSPVKLTTKQQSEQPQQRLHEAIKVEPVRASQQRATQMGSSPSLRSQGEPQSPQSVSFEQQMPEIGIQPAATVKSIHEGNQRHSAESKHRQLPEAAWQSLNPSLQGRVENQTDIADRIPVLATLPDLAAAIQSKGLHPNNLDSRLMASSGAPEPSPAQGLATGQSKPELRKRYLVLDYSPSELSRMAYKLLHSESFDHVPRAVATNDPAKAPLAEKVQHAYDLKDDSERQSQRQGIFSNLTIEQYEEAGDLLLEKFANVIGCYKEARQAKRMMAMELEKEVAQREELVRKRALAVERELTGLRHAGRKVVQGKYT